MKVFELVLHLDEDAMESISDWLDEEHSFLVKVQGILDVSDSYREEK